MNKNYQMSELFSSQLYDFIYPFKNQNFFISKTIYYLNLKKNKKNKEGILVIQNGKTYNFIDLYVSNVGKKVIGSGPLGSRLIMKWARVTTFDRSTRVTALVSNYIQPGTHAVTDFWGFTFFFPFSFYLQKMRIKNYQL